jgi:ATP phosphoribosyltransferase regulatory subunit
VLQLVCQGADAPVAIASGGRYDALVGRFGGEPGGMGFSFEVGAIRELLGTEVTAPQRPDTTLVSFQEPSQLEAALAALQEFHQRGERAELLHQPCATRSGAEAVAIQRGCNATRWLGPTP